jgi:hypothetical protein
MQIVEAVEVSDMDVTANENIVSAVRELIALQQQARTLGLFTDDRELLACPVCGLLEDVTSMGLLITYSKDSPHPPPTPRRAATDCGVDRGTGGEDRGGEGAQAEGQRKTNRLNL